MKQTLQKVMGILQIFNEDIKVKDYYLDNHQQRSENWNFKCFVIICGNYWSLSHHY